MKTSMTFSKRSKCHTITTSECESMTEVNRLFCLFIVRCCVANNYVLRTAQRCCRWGSRRWFSATIADDPLRRSAGRRSSVLLTFSVSRCLFRSQPRRSWLTPSQRCAWDSRSFPLRTLLSPTLGASCCEPPWSPLIRTARAKRRYRQWRAAALFPAGAKVVQ